MRILFITATYPPDVTGGWDQLVEELNQRIEGRGHTTRVLTSCVGAGRPVVEPGVDRTLTLEADQKFYQPASALSYKRRLDANLEACRRTIEEFNPDVIFIHVMWNLTRGVAWMAEQLRPGRVVYYMADHWLSVPDPHENYWADRARGPLKRVFKALAAPAALSWIRRSNRRFSLRLDRILCVSRAIESELIEKVGLPRRNLTVVYNGVDTERFRPLPRVKKNPAEGLSLLFAGSLVWHKGADTVVEALGLLKQRNELGGAKLSIVGGGHPAYEQELREAVERHGLRDRVQFLGAVDREHMAELLPQFDALVFPSRWEEPLARMIQEAMACGVVVIGTLTGGTGELLVDGDTGFTFEPGSAEQLAERIAAIDRAPGTLEQVAGRARRAVVERFDIARTVEEIEAELAQRAFCDDSTDETRASVLLPPAEHRVKITR